MGFAAEKRAGRRVKLPLPLSAKQRKAIHLWAEMNDLEHKSFGYRGRRRLHLMVKAGQEEDIMDGEGVDEAEEFDFAAWAENDEEDEDNFDEDEGDDDN